METIGFDISYHQNNHSTPRGVDFEKMKAYGARFLIARVCQGTWADPDFKDYWQRSKAAGLVRGGYIFCDYRGGVSPEAQVQFMVAQMGSDLGELPLAIDWEKNPYWVEALPSGSVALAMIKRFVDEVRRLTGRDPIFYSNPATLAMLGTIPAWLGRCPLWLAWYRATWPATPAGWGKISIWQAGTPAIGEAAGVESKEIDLDQYNGSLEDMAAEFGFELKGTGETTMANPWSTRARGLYVEDKDGAISAADLANCDFVVAKAGERFTGTVQAAADAKIPCLLFVANEPEWYLNMGLDPSRWPKPEADPMIDITDKMILYAGSSKKRAVHGVMLDTSKTITADKKTLPAPWIADHGQHMLDLIYKRYELPVYMYQNIDPMNAWKNDFQAKEKLIAFIKRNGICTVSFRTTDAQGYPVEGKGPVLPYDDGVTWYFWLYAVAAKGMRFLYSGTKADLYAELGFKPGTVPQEPPTGDDGDTGGGGGTSPDVAALAAKLDALIARWDKVFKV